MHMKTFLSTIRYFHTVRSMSTLRIGVLGVPFEKGQPKIGVGNGPMHFRKAGLIERLEHISVCMQ